MHPLLRLIRWDRPIGSYLLFWPCMMALLLASHGWPPFALVVIFSAGVILTRSAGCVVNDFADRHIDSKVARTSQRPLATQAVTTGQAGILFVLLLLMAGAVTLFTNALTLYLAVAGAFWLSIYPFSKRYTHFPQLILGIAYSWGVPMAFAAKTGTVPVEAGWLFGATYWWIVAFDSIYAMGDYAEDKAAGIQSIAVYFGPRYIMPVVIGCWICSLACFWMTGKVFGLGPYYYVGLGVALGHMGWQWWMLQDKQPDQCLSIFKSNAVLGGILCISIGLGFL